MKKNINVLITGPLPPPAGGISVHIWRLKHLLENDFNLDFIDEAKDKKNNYFNIKSLNIFKYLKRIIASDVLFIHSGNKLLKKLHIITGKLFGKKIIITLHGYGPRRKMPFRAIDAALFKLADKIILVNSDIYKKLSLPLDKCIVKHAFLPPVMSEEPSLPEYINEQIKIARQQNKIIICANASRLDTHNNQDLYGLDICVETIRRLVNKGIPVYFIFTVSSLAKGENRFNEALSLIKKYKLENNFLLLNEKLSFVKLIESSDIVLRPTNTDGDALTVREALFLGKKVLASDIVERPEGTSLFKTRDIDDLEKRLSLLINENNSKKDNNSTAENDSNSLKDFYSTLITTLFIQKNN